MEKLNKREKIMMGISIASIGALGVLGFKYLDTKKTMELLAKEKEGINDRLNFVEFLVIESDCIPKALQNANNKLSRVQSKIVVATERLLKVPTDIDAQKMLENCKAEESKLIEHITKAMKLDEAVKADQNIYAK